MSYIQVNNVCKEYPMGDSTIIANNDISFEVEQGEFVVILGPSGAGKSTLLNILGGMDNCDRGSMLIDGKDIAQFNQKQLTEYRRYDVGFVFQFYNLVANLSAKENVELASQIVEDALDIDEIIDLVGLSHRKNNFPAQLSGGEQQRVAIARALAKNPKMLLCDEPTGALDYKTGKQILKLLQDMSINLKTTVILITHNSAIVPMANRIIEINDAKGKNIRINEQPIDVNMIEW